MDGVRLKRLLKLIGVHRNSYGRWSLRLPLMLWYGDVFLPEEDKFTRGWYVWECMVRFNKTTKERNNGPFWLGKVAV